MDLDLEKNDSECPCYTISKHACERFAERMQEYDNKMDIQFFINNHLSDINERINKLIKYGTEIYEGKLRNYPYNKIYINDAWIIICDPKQNNVITLYKITLGAGDDLDSQYIKRMTDKIIDLSNQRKQKEKDNNLIIERNKEAIEQNKIKLAEYKSIQKQMEEYNESLSIINDNLNVGIKEIDSHIADIVDKLVHGN